MEDPKVDKYVQEVGEDGAPELSPEQQRSVDAYIQVLTELLHSPKSRDSVVATLTASPDPFDCVPTAAVATNDMGVNLMKQAGQDAHFGIQLGASHFLITELIHLGYAAAGWEDLTEDEFNGIYEDSLQMVIERGLADGSIDPIQLQLETEPLLDENQRAGAKAFQQEAGLEDEPSQAAMVDQQVSSAVRQKEGQIAKKQAVDRKKEAQSALQGGGQ